MVGYPCPSDAPGPQAGPGARVNFRRPPPSPSMMQALDHGKHGSRDVAGKVHLHLHIYLHIHPQGKPRTVFAVEMSLTKSREMGWLQALLLRAACGGGGDCPDWLQIGGGRRAAAGSTSGRELC